MQAVSIQELDPEIQKVVDTIERLLRLAAKNANEHEAANATAKAQELLTAYNLDMAVVEQSSGKSSKRTDEKLAGGLYHYQRKLWRSVAELNFCLYWNMYVWDKEKTRRVKDRYYGGSRVEKGGYSFQHRVVGKEVNVISTRNMASYLEQAIERVTRERLGGNSSLFFTKWASSFREGVADRICEKVYARRKEFLAEETRKQQEEAARARAEGREGVSISQAITLRALVAKEEDANYDFLFGEGWSAKQAAKQAERARLRAEAEAQHAQRAKEHPEEARKREEEARKSRRRSSWNAGTGRTREDNLDDGAYYSGYDTGDKVSLDPQVDSAVKGRLK